MNGAPVEKLIPLNEHLEELSMLCIFIDEVTLDPIKKEIISNTNKIGEWLKLASDLKSVEISPGGYESHNDLFCEPRMVFLEDNMSNYGALSLNLTKFIFLTHAMDNTQKLIKSKAKPDIAGITGSAIRSEFEFSKLKIDKYPLGFCFYAQQFIQKIECFFEENKININNHLKIESDNPAYAHCLLRNLRNCISHGNFPLQYGFDTFDEIDIKIMVDILNDAIRITCLYIQCTLFNFCAEMNSEHFHSHKERCEEIISNQYRDEDMDWALFYINNFGNKLALSLHFGLEQKITSYIW